MDPSTEECIEIKEAETFIEAETPSEDQKPPVVSAPQKSLHDNTDKGCRPN